jgi:hypothetical protein
MFYYQPWYTLYVPGFLNIFHVHYRSHCDPLTPRVYYFLKI